MAVYPGMPSDEFHDPANLRASCFFHNTRRGHVAAFEAELAAAGGEKVRRDPFVVRGRAYGSRSPKVW